MAYFWIIFEFQVRQIIRNRLAVVCMSLFLLFGFYSMYSGYAVIERQRTVIDSIQAGYQTKFNRVSAKFHPKDTTASAKRDSSYAAMPVMINYWLPQNVVSPPSAIAFLSPGQRDIYPYYTTVRSTSDYLDASDSEIRNPLKQFFGNLDLAFVIIYLLPLLGVGISFNILSEEKDAGTYRLLVCAGLSEHRLVVYKLLCRILFLAILLSLLFLTAAIAGPDGASRTSLMFLQALLYLLFWAGFFYFTLRMRLGGNQTALVQLFCWAFILIILPPMISSLISASYPVPLKTGIASYQRHIGEEVWNTDKKILVNTFLKNNPRYRKYYKADWDTTQWSGWPIAGYYDLKERKVSNYAKNYNLPVLKRKALSGRLMIFNPALLIQTAFNITAGTSAESYEAFKTEMQAFQKKWQYFIYSYELPDKSMTPESLRKFPKFRLKEQPAITGSSVRALAALFVWTAFLVLLGLVAGRIPTGN